MSISEDSYHTSTAFNFIVPQTLQHDYNEAEDHISIGEVLSRRSAANLKWVTALSLQVGIGMELC